MSMFLHQKWHLLLKPNILALANKRVILNIRYWGRMIEITSRQGHIFFVYLAAPTMDNYQYKFSRTVSNKLDG